MQFLDLPLWESGLRGLMAFLCRVIYPIIGFMYELFSNVSKINILSGAVEPIYQRVTLILTIVMVFYITFQFVKYVVQPDNLTDKEKGAGNIVYKAIIVVVLIAFVPKIFEMAYTIQSKIIDTNVISKVILGPQAATEEANLGSGFSATIFNMFYYVDEENASKDCHDGLDCATLVDNNIYNLSTENSLSSLSIGLNATDKKGETPLITFDGLLAVIFGGFILYILILYCIDVGVRWVQLIYLQIIAPIPIIGYLSPKKDGIFQKWTKQCFITYLDLFLRVAIINIVLLLCDTILRAKSNLDQTGGLLAGLGEVSGMMETLIYIVLIMGVMLFAHKAPKMLLELFPKAGAASGNFGLSAKDRNLDRAFGAAAGVAIGAGAGLATGIGQGFRRRNSIGKDGKPKGIGAGIWGATKGAISGTIGGATRGLTNGAKKGNILKNSVAGAQKQIQSNKRFGTREENGYKFTDQIGDITRGFIGARSRVDMLEEQKAPIKRYQDINEKIRKANSDMTAEAESQIKKGKGKYSGVLAAAEKRLQNLQDDQNIREKTAEAIRKSIKYKNIMDKIEADNVGKSDEEIKTLKEKALETMTTEEIGNQLTKAQQDVKKAKDLAVFDFITNGEYKGVDEITGEDIYGENAKLTSIRTGLTTEIEQYNLYNKNADYSIDDTLIKSAMLDGEIFDSIIKSKGDVKIPARNPDNSIKRDSEGNIIYLNYNPDKNGISNQIDKSQNKLVEISQHQEAIKRETSGSGINEGKK